ncbi:MAG TPA: hypothetical protein QGF58_26195 [Myxococcota bacterium]|nr:hypothetical protein [Myxococcota bacterium]
MELANTAAEGGIDTLMLTHMVPTTDAAQAELLFGDPIRDVFSGEVIVASGDTWFTLDVDPQQETQGLSE